MALVREAVPYVMSDYDGTIARTGETPVGGVDVNGAYKLAIAGIFDDEAAQQFEDTGGHNHRAPIEIVTDLLRNTSGFSSDQLKRIAARLSADKLDILLDQIGSQNEDGTIWPRPTDGFVEFWGALSRAKTDRKIGTAVISAGHTDFIVKWFDTFDLEQPDAFSTAEVVDNLLPLSPVEEKTKPAALPLVIARAALTDKYGDAVNTIYYAGDSEVKDGGLAINAGVDHFVLIDEANAGPGWSQLGSRLQLPSYREVA